MEFEPTPEQQRQTAERWAGRPRPDFTLQVQIVVDGDLVQLAYDWVTHMTAAFVGQDRGRLAGASSLPGAARKKLQIGDPYGDVTVTRFPYTTYGRPKRRTLSDSGLKWFRAELADMPEIIRVSAGTLTEQSWAGGVDLEIRYFYESPGCLLLSAHFRESAFADPALQQQWLSALYTFADRVNPGYGEIGYRRGEDGATTVEDTADRRVIDYTDCFPAFTVGRSRQTLRGYDWLTIVPQELAAKLGGAEALTATGAFAEVRQLAAGGVALLSTADFRDYNTETAGPVFRALAPVLPPGRPWLRYQYPDFPPRYVVEEDPASP